MSLSLATSSVDSASCCSFSPSVADVVPVVLASFFLFLWPNTHTHTHTWQYTNTVWIVNKQQEELCVHLRENTHSASLYTGWNQGCPHDVKSQDRDETETVNLQDQDETETFHFYKLSRPRRDRDAEPSRPRWDWARDVPYLQTLKTETKRSTSKTDLRPRRSRPTVS